MLGGPDLSHHFSLKGQLASNLKQLVAAELQRSDPGKGDAFSYFHYIAHKQGWDYTTTVATT